MEMPVNSGIAANDSPIHQSSARAGGGVGTGCCVGQCRARQAQPYCRIEVAKGLCSTIVPLHRKGWTLRAIAEHLNAKGIPAARGGN
jgi:hypothetical protein